MNILVLGATGMLGHKVYQILKARFPRTSCTIRGSVQSLSSLELFQGTSVHGGVHATDLSSVRKVLEAVKPDVVVNCVGLIKQRGETATLSQYMAVNGVFPRHLADLCVEREARLIHLSTDCVYSGSRGGYSEADLPDAVDPYGVSKRAGEVTGPRILTLRTSFIGRELSTRASLLDWFLARNGETVRGFTRAIFSGVTTTYFGKLLGDLIEKYPDLSGLYHVAATPIAKHDLLCQLKAAYDLQIEIVPDSAFHCDRSLDGTLFASTTGVQVPSWPELIRDLRRDSTPYDTWRMAHETA